MPVRTPKAATLRKPRRLSAEAAWLTDMIGSHCACGNHRLACGTGELKSPPCARAGQPPSLPTTKGPNKSRANPKVDAAMKLLVPGAPNPEQVTPRGALRSMQRYRLHLGF